MAGRNLQLDVLRGVAILMVLVCHSIFLREPTWDMPLWRPCWSGVDLFFVLSGFLIAGLLFSEFKRTGEIHFRRFAVRRAIKIYPAFYVLVIVTVVIWRAQHRPMVWTPLISDLTFMQSYFPGEWGHFWSLSVEEHFYILLPILLFFLMRRTSADKADPFARLPLIFLAVAAMVFLARLVTTHFVPYSLQTHEFATHLRLDSLFFGVILAYLFHFHGERFSDFVRRRRILIFGFAGMLLAPMFVIGQYDSRMYTWGFTCLYLGYGCLMIAFLYTPIHDAPRPVKSGLKALAYLGSYSYSIYLWHPFCARVIAAWLPKSLAPAFLTLYYCSAILLGVGMAKLVEIPALRLRDRLFPRTVAAAPPIEGLQAPAYATARAPS